jgi:class 3 adenylate cyclase
MSATRRLAAILAVDVVGYSRGLRGDLIDPAIAAHRGHIVKRTGDGSIIEFRSVGGWRGISHAIKLAQHDATGGDASREILRLCAADPWTLTSRPA